MRRIPIATLDRGRWPRNMFKPAKSYAISAGGTIERTGKRVHGIDRSLDGEDRPRPRHGDHDD
jgi:hypothetical protein